MLFCLAVSIMLQAVAPAYAQLKKLPRGLLPAPGNVGIVLNLLGPRDGRKVVTATNHPLFESSWMGDPAEIVATTKYGKVSSADLWLWMTLRESPNKAFLYELFKKSKVPSEKAEIAEALKAEVDEYVFTNLIIPRIMPAAAPDVIYNLKHEFYTLPAWQTVFLEKVVKPRTVISDADRQKYLQEHITEVVAPNRLRVRYIFMRSAETDDLTLQNRTEVDMDQLRTSILRGEVDFGDAARKHSQAPSASRGGEIPPFQEGELFFTFENAASGLEPGGISPVFRGPNGLYMVQLIEVVDAEKPSLTDPRQAKLVEEGLSRQVLRASYNIYMRDMLRDRRRIVEKTFAWDSLEDHEILGEVCDFVISKEQFRSAWPGIESNNLQLKTDVLSAQLRALLEREAMAQDVRELGFANDPLLERARVMAGNIIRRDAWVEKLRMELPLSEEAVHAFWKNNPDLFTPLALKRVTRLTLTPSNTAPLPAQTRLEMEQVLGGATGQPAAVTIAKREVFDEEKSSLVYDALERTDEAFDMMERPDEDMNFYISGEGASTTQTINDLINSSETDAELPSLEGDPPPGLDAIESPREVTTGTLESLQDRPAEAETLDLTTTAPQGGQAPPGAAGGLRSSELGGEDILPQLEATGRPGQGTKPTPVPDSTVVVTERTPAPDNTDLKDVDVEVGGRAPVKLKASVPAGTPRAGAVPVGITAPAVAPMAPLEATPNVRKQLPPPATSAIPYNPEWFYARREPSEIRKVIKDYSSSDWLLTMDDLGFVYLEDMPDVPRKVEKVPVGAFTRPIVRGQSAVSWFIEEARPVEKQPYEAIKTHVYDVYRNTQIDKKVSHTYDSELDKAGVDYKF